MTQSLTGVAVLVPDYDQAIAFFTTVLRFVLARAANEQQQACTA